MNYNYEEWKRMKVKGLIKYTLDIKNFIMIFILITVFTIVSLLTKKILPFKKEFTVHIIFVIVILIFLWIGTQLIRWMLYKNILEGCWGNRLAFVRFYEILMGLINIWIPLGMLLAVYGIDYSNAMWRIKDLNLYYILNLVGYISLRCILWIVIGTLFEVLISTSEDNYDENNSEHFIMVDKYI